MPKDEKSGLGSGLDAIFGPNFSDIIDDIQNTPALLPVQLNFHPLIFQNRRFVEIQKKLPEKILTHPAHLI